MYFHNVVGIGSYITSTTNMYNKYFTHGRDGAPVRVTSFRKQCFDGLAVHVSDKLVLLPQCPCLSRERVVAQYMHVVFAVVAIFAVVEMVVHVPRHVDDVHPHHMGLPPGNDPHGEFCLPRHFPQRGQDV